MILIILYIFKYSHIMNTQKKKKHSMHAINRKLDTADEKVKEIRVQKKLEYRIKNQNESTKRS